MTILYVFDSGTASHAAVGALKQSGYEVVVTNSSMQAIALLFILHPIAAIVLHRRKADTTTTELARSLKAVRPEVPIVVLSCDVTAGLPPCVDACVSTGEPAKLTDQLERLVTAKFSPVLTATR